jgi:hypothetical protein
MNHDYNTPVEGSTNWHVPLNENFEALDIDVEIRDAEANRSNYDPVEGSKYLATDSGRIYLGTGSEWQAVGTSGPTPTYDSVRTKFVEGVAYVARFPGPDLGTKLRNAVMELPRGHQTLRVTPKPDGGPWNWDVDVTIDALEQGGVELLVGDNVQIEYGGTGWPLTVENTYLVDDRFRLVGGRWRSTDDADGWLRLRSCTQSFVSPSKVDFRTESGGAVGVSLENHNYWTELNVVEGTYKVDNGIDTVPAGRISDASTTATESFQGTTLRDVQINHFADDGFGIRLRGNTRYSSLRRPNVFPNGTESAALVLGTSDALGMTIDAFQAETSADVDGTVAVRTTPEYEPYRAPLFVGGQVEDSAVSRRTDLADPGHTLHRISVEAGEMSLDSWDLEKPRVTVDPAEGSIEGDEVRAGSDGELRLEGGTRSILNHTGGEQLELRHDWDTKLRIASDRSTFLDPVEFPVVDVRTVSSPSRGLTAYHDGSGGHREGPATYTSDGWVSVVDGSSID